MFEKIALIQYGDIAMDSQHPAYHKEPAASHRKTFSEIFKNKISPPAVNRRAKVALTSPPQPPKAITASTQKNAFAFNRTCQSEFDSKSLSHQHITAITVMTRVVLLT